MVMGYIHTFFHLISGKQKKDDCIPCDPGHYCGTSGLSAATGECDAGWYCVRGAWSAKPADLANYTSISCVCPVNSTGGQCQPGFYCPKGSVEPLACLPGETTSNHD